MERSFKYASNPLLHENGNETSEMNIITFCDYNQLRLWLRDANIDEHDDFVYWIYERYKSRMELMVVANYAIKLEIFFEVASQNGASFA